MSIETLDIEIRKLRRINTGLEIALRETVDLQAPHTLDVQIHRIRRAVEERIQNLQFLKSQELHVHRMKGDEPVR